MAQLIKTSWPRCWMEKKAEEEEDEGFLQKEQNRKHQMQLILLIPMALNVGPNIH